MPTSHRLLMYAMEREKDSQAEKSGTKLRIELKTLFLSIVAPASTNLSALADLTLLDVYAVPTTNTN